MSILSERVKKLRRSKGQSQREVGKALGKSRETVSKYEIGEREPDPDGIVLLAKHFNASADYILGITNVYQTLDDKMNPFNSELCAYEKYFKDEEFIPYLQLAVRMKDSNAEINEFDTLISKLIKQTRKPKHT